jgi:hypothetical protein
MVSEKGGEIDGRAYPQGKATLSPQVPEQPQEAQALFTAAAQRLGSSGTKRWEGSAIGGTFFL